MSSLRSVRGSITLPAHSLARYFYSLLFIFNGVHELPSVGSAILTESPIWFAITLLAGFG